MSSLATALPEEIDRVRKIQDEFKSLRGMPNVIVEPQIAFMEMDIKHAIQALATGSVVEVDMLRAYEKLKGYTS